MRYALLLHHVEPGPGDIPEDVLAETQAAFDAYAKALDASGVLRAAEVLGPTELSTTVTVRDESVQVQDGPFAEAKEMLGGVFVIEVPDVDAALAWAEQCPAAQYGAIEVRPVAISFRDGSWRT